MVAALGVSNAFSACPAKKALKSDATPESRQQGILDDKGDAVPHCKSEQEEDVIDERLAGKKFLHELQLAPPMVGVHPENRGSQGVNALEVSILVLT